VFSVEKGVADRLSKDDPLGEKLMHPTSETPYKHFLERLDAIFVGALLFCKWLS
jgi:hypothetical protein